MKNVSTPFDYVSAAFANLELTPESIRKMPSYIVMRFLSYSTNSKYPAIEVANLLNRYVFNWDNEMIYDFLCYATPINSKFYMSKFYKKNKKDLTKSDEKMITILMYHYEVSEDEATEMLSLLSKENRKNLLLEYKFLFNK